MSDADHLRETMEYARRIKRGENVPDRPFLDEAKIARQVAEAMAREDAAPTPPKPRTGERRGR